MMLQVLLRLWLLVVIEIHAHVHEAQRVLAAVVSLEEHRFAAAATPGRMGGDEGLAGIVLHHIIVVGGLSRLST